VRAQQELLLKAERGSSLSLRWTITNSSKSRAWPCEPQIRLSDIPESFKESNPHLLEPITLKNLIEPSQSTDFEVHFNIPKEDERKLYTLNFYLCNPLKHFEKFGEPLLALIEALDPATLPIPAP
jgi:hypothetical protein